MSSHPLSRLLVTPGVWLVRRRFYRSAGVWIDLVSPFVRFFESLDRADTESATNCNAGVEALPGVRKRPGCASDAAPRVGGVR